MCWLICSHEPVLSWTLCSTICKLRCVSLRVRLVPTPGSVGSGTLTGRQLGVSEIWDCWDTVEAAAVSVCCCASFCSLCTLELTQSSSAHLHPLAVIIIRCGFFIPQTSQQQQEEEEPPLLFSPCQLSVWKRKDAPLPSSLLPGGCLGWGLVSVCCDSWGSHEKQSGQPPPSFLTSFTPICQRGPSSGLLVQCEVSLSLSVTPHFISGLLTVWPSPWRSADAGQDFTTSLWPVESNVLSANAAVLRSDAASRRRWSGHVITAVSGGKGVYSLIPVIIVVKCSRFVRTLCRSVCFWRLKITFLKCCCWWTTCRWWQSTVFTTRHCFS